MAGLLGQTVFFLLALALAKLGGSYFYEIFLWNAAAGIPVWTVIFLRLKLFLDESAALCDMQKKLTEKEDAKLDSIRAMQLNVQRFLVPLTEILFALLLLWGSAILMAKALKTMPSFTGAPLRDLVFSAGLSFAVLIGAFYWCGIAKNPARKFLNGGVGGIAALAFLSAMATAGACVEYFRLPGAGWWIFMFMGGFNILIAVEVTIKIFSRFFLPKGKGSHHRPAFESYVYGILCTPGNGWRTFTDVLGHQFGFNLDEGIFFRTLKALFLPFVFFSILLIFAFSSVVIIGPSEKGVLLHLGNLSGRYMDSGIHLKAPWPLETVRKFNTWEIRRVHVGSHKPVQNTSDIYQANLPVLWTNQHGVLPDELLIVAPPADLMAQAGNSDDLQGDRKAPSISLAGTDVVVEYRTSDLERYILAGSSPDDYFKAIAEAAVSRTICRYDIDVLFCEGRIELSKTLKLLIQQEASSHKLGIEVLNVGIGGVHPPQEVAESFQETVAALQEKETAIQLAKQYAVKNMTETAGSVDMSEKLLAAIDSGEKQGSLKTSEISGEILHNSDGLIAQSLAEADAYRWTKENQERGKADRFKSELLIYNAAPSVYVNGYYLGALEGGLKQAVKYVLISERKDLILRFDFKRPATLSSMGMPQMPYGQKNDRNKSPYGNNSNPVSFEEK